MLNPHCAAVFYLQIIKPSSNAMAMTPLENLDVEQVVTLLGHWRLDKVMAKEYVAICVVVVPIQVYSK